jgi:hypothetical protein
MSDADRSLSGTAKGQMHARYDPFNGSLLGRGVTEIGLLLLLMAITLLIASCSEDAAKLDRLDRNRGFGPYVLGDSMYDQVAQTARDSLTTGFGSEMEVLGHVVSSRVPVTFGNRFNFGVEATDQWARAIDGQVTSYTLLNRDFPRARFSELLDSLRSEFGAPTHRVDSTLYVSQTPIPDVERLTREEIIQIARERGFIDERDQAAIDSVSALRGYVLRLESRPNGSSTGYWCVLRESRWLHSQCI